MLIAAAIFFVSLIGIIILFGIKYWEVRNERPSISRVRTRADVRALEIKAWLLHLRAELEKVPPSVVALGRFGVRDVALGIAGVARSIERQAHKLADLVSHKRHFERKESKNSYLKRVSDYEPTDTKAE